jgi:meso-butanediol dehydrogenase/(S,S)-butanediol dehydrogenase/diacetyl reductase
MYRANKEKRMPVFSDLRDKRVMITGGASGIGLATARRFVEEAARVFIVDWDGSALSQTLERNPAMVGGIESDVGEEAAVERAFIRMDDLLGGVDILISNAGISYRCPFLDIKYAQWSKVLRINLDGMFLCTQQAIRRMQKEGSGVILLTASTNGLEGHPLYADYNSSKAGVILLAKTLALEFAPWLRVNAVCPGMVLTPMQKAEYTPEMFERANANLPLNRHANPEEVAALFAFLASEEAGYITGQAIPIDGGETSGPYDKGQGK